MVKDTSAALRFVRGLRSEGAGEAASHRSRRYSLAHYVRRRSAVQLSVSQLTGS
jgi:hypothetical protein